MTTTTRAAANRPMSAPSVPLVLMTVLWVTLLSVVAPSVGGEVSVLIGGCLLLADISLTLLFPSVLAGVHFAIVGVVIGVGVGGC